MLLVHTSFSPFAAERTGIAPFEPELPSEQHMLGPPSQEMAAWHKSLAQNPEAGQALREMHDADAPATLRLATTIASLPEPGTRFVNFDLKCELGRGAFGRVFLAEQADLSNRRVVLKISSQQAGEAKTLAQLLHTNVVPVYSIHHQGAHQAVCMPYLGATTVADVLKAIHDQGSLPASGKMLVSTLHGRQSTLHDSRLLRPSGSSKSHSARPSSQEFQLPSKAVPSILAPQDGEAQAAVGSRVLLEKLEGYSYVEAVLWIASRLADGLAHAHERGILHRDLKPANILLTDEGQPMLLDFNLAEDVKTRDQAATARLGGTLPYMSPEQFVAFQGGPKDLDAHTDLYSLGLILFELLAGRFPFPHHRGTTKKMIGPMLRDRRGQLPSLCSLNPSVSPAVEAIVHKCLQADPAQRYQSARDLQEDLQRQLEHRPLLHAGEPSWRERAGKWMVRHPRLSSSTTVAAFAAALLLAVGLGCWWQAERLLGVEAAEHFGRFQDDVTAVQFLFNGQAAEGVQVDRSIEACQATLAKYEVFGNPAWREQRQVRYLATEQQGQLDQDVSLLLLYLARANLMQAKAPKTSAAEQTKLLDQALGYNRLAEACFRASPAPPAVFAQRAELAEGAGQDDEAESARRKAQEGKPQTPFDAFLTAREHVVKGRYSEALPLLRDLTSADSKNVHAWFLLARCHDGLYQDEEAVRAYTATLVLWPKSHQVYFNRALAFLRRGDYKASVADFDKALELKADQGEVLLNRALAYHGMKKLRTAEEDLTAALHAGASFSRVYFLRAKMREELGDTAGAKKDRDEGMRHPPTDEVSFTTRGFANLSNPKAALADFDKALELNPRYLHALANKAHVLSELLGKTEDSIKVLDKILEHYPDHVQSWSSRGVLWARLGKRDQAQKDGAEALKRRGDPATQYQVAGIYALTANKHKEDFKQALQLLATALRRGFGHDWLDRDPDLDPIRNTSEFRRILGAAQALAEPEKQARSP